jgi:hypothetical protein
MAKFVYILLGILCGALLPVGISAQESQDSGGPDTVFTGIYLMNIYDLDINAYSFYADFYVWFRWKGERDPTNIEFVNAVEKWGFTQIMFHEEEPKVLPDGYFYNGLRIEGRFYYSFILNRFPMDRHGLEIRIENVDYLLDSLVYLPDTSTHLMREDFIIPGWKIDGTKMQAHANFYQTNFGEPVEGGTSRYSNFTFILFIERPLSYFLLKLMLPLLVVILASLGALFIHPTYIDARISLPIGGLLSCVFLQQSYSSALPDIGYMVLMDRIYIVSYMLIAAIMLRIIIVGNKTASVGEEIIPRLRRTDRRRFFQFFLFFVTAVALLILST